MKKFLWLLSLLLFVLPLFSHAYITSPENGDRWWLGSNNDVEWQRTDFPAQTLLKIELGLLDASARFYNIKTVATAAPNTGSFNWCVPTTLTPSSNYYLRLAGSSGQVELSEPFEITKGFGGSCRATPTTPTTPSQDQTKPALAFTAPSSDQQKVGDTIAFQVHYINYSPAVDETNGLYRSYYPALNWNFGDGSLGQSDRAYGTNPYNSIVHRYLKAGTYTVTVSDNANGASAQKTLTLTADSATSSPVTTPTNPATTSTTPANPPQDQNKDTDNDGVPDAKDQCPGEYAKTSNGCPFRWIGAICNRTNPAKPFCQTTYFGDSNTPYGCSLSCVPTAPVPTTPPQQTTTNSPPAPSDSDGDGVPDAQDKCPNTPKNSRVDNRGCPLIPWIGYYCDQTDPAHPTCKANYLRRDDYPACQKSCLPPKPACTEYPFSQIVKSLDDNQYTKISENSFKGWAQEDPLDNVAKSHGLGSGDKEDVKGKMSQIQICYSNNWKTVDLQGDPLPNSLFTQMENKIKAFTDLGNPVNIGYRIYIRGFFKGNYVIRLFGAHEVIALELKDESNWLVKKFSLKVLDPNNHTFDTLTCQVDSLYQGYKGVPLPGGGTGVATICHSQNLVNTVDTLKQLAGQGSDIFLMLEDDLFGGIGTAAAPLVQARQKICAANPALDLCKQTPVQRLTDDYPEIDNFSTPDNSSGNCKGWSLFSMKVAYLGDFVGECHPAKPQSKAFGGWFSEVEKSLNQLASGFFSFDWLKL